MSIGTILIIILVIFLLGGFSGMAMASVMPGLVFLVPC